MYQLKTSGKPYLPRNKASRDPYDQSQVPTARERITQRKASARGARDRQLAALGSSRQFFDFRGELIDTEALHLLYQGGSVDIQNLGRLTFHAICFLERLENEVFLKI